MSQSSFFKGREDVPGTLELRDCEVSYSPDAADAGKPCIQLGEGARLIEDGVTAAAPASPPGPRVIEVGGRGGKFSRRRSPSHGRLALRERLVGNSSGIWSRSGRSTAGDAHASTWCAGGATLYEHDVLSFEALGRASALGTAPFWAGGGRSKDGFFEKAYLKGL